ncbi:hypothetical protein DUNSADRAFT_8336, partial [Dunaliella salina]
MPLVKIKSTVRRMHDFQLQQDIHQVLSDPNLVLIQWLPDVFQAVLMTRESVPANTKGTAEFQIVENQPILSGPGALTMEINQVCCLSALWFWRIKDQQIALADCPEDAFLSGAVTMEINQVCCLSVLWFWRINDQQIALTNCPEDAFLSGALTMEINQDCCLSVHWFWGINDQQIALTKCPEGAFLSGALAMEINQVCCLSVPWFWRIYDQQITLTNCPEDAFLSEPLLGPGIMY